MSTHPLSPIGQFWLAMGAVKEERERQDAKWGSQRNLPNPTWLAILVEEVGEVAKDEREKAYGAWTAKQRKRVHIERWP